MILRSISLSLLNWELMKMGQADGLSNRAPFYRSEVINAPRAVANEWQALGFSQLKNKPATKMFFVLFCF